MSTENILGFKGIHNLGNTCYMNSILQCLSHLINFHPNNRKFYDSCKTCSKGSLIECWYKFQVKMWENSDNDIINPTDLFIKFKEKCDKNNLYFDDFNQNDVSDFLINFMELIHCDIKKRVKMEFSCEIEDEGDKICVKSNKTWQNFYEKNYSYIIENFYSQLLDITSCPQCKYYTTSHDPIQIITLDIKDSYNSLEDCLKMYSVKNKLDNDNKWKCDRCKHTVNPVKQTKLWKTSDVIIILLKSYNNNFSKINKKISYPLILNLENFNINWGNDNNEYSLESFCIHDGSLNFGHYYAICKNYLNNNWYICNDENINQISDNNILNHNPYLFFYKRISQS